MITRIILKIVLISGILFSNACIDEVDFDVPNEYQNTTVILGKIVLGNPSTVEVSIQGLFDFSFEGSVYKDVESVKIINEEGDKLEVPVSEVGKHKLLIYPDSGFEVEAEKFYSLEVLLFDGQAFKSEPAKLMPVPKAGELKPNLAEKEVINFLTNEYQIQRRIEYRVSTSLLSGIERSRSNLKWDFSRTYKITDNKKNICYATDFIDFDLIEIVNQADIATISLNDHLILEQDYSLRIVEGQYVFAIQEALDDDAILFWNQMKGLSTNNGTFYEPPPGQLITNFYKTNNTEGSVFGYFYATQHDTLSTYIDSTFINQFIPFCPRPPTGGPTPCDECCDCQMFLSTKKPSFWIN